MSLSDEQGLSAVTRRLGNSVLLTEQETDFLEDLQTNRAEIEAGTDFVIEGDEFGATYLVRSGWVMRYRVTPDGKRQIIAFALPGDVIGLHVNYERHACFTAAAVTDVELCLIEPIRIIELYRSHPVIAAGLDWMTVTSFNIVSEHVVSLGVRPARVRILHLLLELYCRLMAIGMAREDGFDSPLTQTLIGDSLGLTSVYVSKSLTRLRKEGLVDVKGGNVHFPNIDRAFAAASFDATFLERFRPRDRLPNATDPRLRVEA